MFNKYDAYKDSGVEWLGDIPEEWSIKPGLVAFSENKRSNKGMVRNTVLSLSYGKIIIKPEEKLVGLVPESFETYQLVEPSDIIIRCTDLQNDQTSLRTGLAKDAGIITSAYLNLNVKKGFDSKYLHYYLHALDTTKVLYKLGSGLRQNLSFLDFKRLPVLDIPLSQQQKISSFLDQKTSEIDQAIAIKEQQIVLLNERKQIVIQKAVTQGLNPNVATKDSGVEWIGQIPEHWKCVKLKYFIDLIPGYAFKSEEYSSNDKDIKLLRGINVSPNQIKWSETVYWPSEKVDMYEEYLLQEGDIVIAMDRPWVSGGIRIAEIGKHDLPALLLQRVARMRSKVGISNKYLKILLTNDLFLAYFTPMLTGISVPHISGDQIENFICPLPSIDEQNQIIQYLEHNLSEIKKAKELLLTQIEKLKEYKTTLINDAVTGKIKVA